jgi:cardiolipin synthase (CMP-forming)
VRNEQGSAADHPSLPVVSNQVLTLPNVLSFLRLVCVPVFLWLILTGQDGWALVVLTASGISDYLDGKIARHYGLVSRIGQLLDPLADRLYIVSTLFGLAYRSIIPWWLVGILVAREVFGTALLLVVRRYGYVGLPVNFIGKAATFNLLYAFPFLLLAQISTTLATVALAVGWAFLWWGTGLYWLAGALYAVQVRDLVRAEKAERTAGR